jgi:hypothetical protein
MAVGLVSCARTVAVPTLAFGAFMMVVMAKYSLGPLFSGGKRARRSTTIRHSRLRFAADKAGLLGERSEGSLWDGHESHPVRRWGYWMTPTPRARSWQQLKDGAYFVRIRLSDPRTGRATSTRERSTGPTSRSETRSGSATS